MKRLTRFVVAVLLAAMFFSVPGKAEAQTYHENGGALVVEENLLLGNNQKQLYFVSAKNIAGPLKVQVQTHLSEGVVNNFKALNFPQGLERGQVIQIWSGDFNSFNSTSWLNFWVTLTNSSEVYYANTMFPVQNREQYKEPMITSISETGGYGVPYLITVKGIFDTTIPSLILINKDVFVPQKAITQTAPGLVQFTMPSGNFIQFPSGKYLLTLCQASKCDSLQGRHR